MGEVEKFRRTSGHSRAPELFCQGDLHMTKLSLRLPRSEVHICAVQKHRSGAYARLSPPRNSHALGVSALQRNKDIELDGCALPSLKEVPLGWFWPATAYFFVLHELFAAAS